MGRLIAAIIVLAIGVAGAMYWGQAQQANASPGSETELSLGLHPSS
jgi:hypothetical protein